MRWHSGPVPDDPNFHPQAEGWHSIREPTPLVLQLLALPSAAILYVFLYGLLDLLSLFWALTGDHHRRIGKARGILCPSSGSDDTQSLLGCMCCTLRGADVGSDSCACLAASGGVGESACIYPDFSLSAQRTALRRRRGWFAGGAGASATRSNCKEQRLEDVLEADTGERISRPPSENSLLPGTSVNRTPTEHRLQYASYVR
jgi:hypothetical protein